jgi:O-antigen ligase
MEADQNSTRNKLIVLSGKFLFYTVLIFLFLLPWQTRYIFGPAFIANEAWEYGTKSLYGTEILAWLIIVLFLVCRWTNFKKNNLRKFLVYDCLILGLFLAAFLSGNSNISYYSVYRLLLGIIVCLIIGATWKSFNFSTAKLMIAFWASGILQGILAIFQFFSQQVLPDKWFGLAEQNPSTLGTAIIELSSGRWLRAYGAFGWPNSLGIYLAVTWILGFLIYIKIYNSTLLIKKITYGRAILTAGQVIILTGLILSFSRGAWLAAGVGIVVLIFLIKKLSQQLKSIFVQLMYAVAIIIFFFITLYPLFTTRFTVENRLESRSVTERVSQWKEAYQIILRHPWTGVGPGVLTYFLHIRHPEFHVWEIQPTHNIYLLALAENGFIICGFLALIYSLFLKYIWRYNRLYLSVISVIVISGLFDHWLWSLYGGLMTWWVVWGIGLSKEQTVLVDN